MNWQPLAEHAWEPPLAFAARFADEGAMALLYSGRQEAATGGRSFLFLEPAYHHTGTQWDDVPTPSATGDLPDWVGYFGYEMGHAAPTPSPVSLPGFWFTRYQRLFLFDHQAQTITEHGRYHAETPLTLPAAQPSPALPEVARLESNMSRATYTSIVAATIAAIEAGDFYQANITRKFHGELASPAPAFSVFSALCAASPAPYSAFIRHGGVAIASSSPELFLKIDDGEITSRPIKGSMRRGSSEAEDAELKQALASSGKNLAENLMIVDLMRHDLAQCAQVGSVAVIEQSALYSYATIHHLISTVRASKQPGTRDIDVIRACFPPGSMTGAPKRAAIDWCATQERQARGVYSGAIGWLGAQGCELSVTIRTLVMRDACFEFQVGGGIVAESDPDDEWQETLVKARGIATALGIPEDALKKL